MATDLVPDTEVFLPFCEVAGEEYALRESLWSEAKFLHFILVTRRSAEGSSSPAASPSRRALSQCPHKRGKPQRRQQKDVDSPSSSSLVVYYHHTLTQRHKNCVYTHTRSTHMHARAPFSTSLNIPFPCLIPDSPLGIILQLCFFAGAPLRVGFCAVG